jgi:hypothetical protein
MDYNSLRADPLMQLIRVVIRSMPIEGAEEVIDRERTRIWDDASLSIENRKKLDLHLQLMLMREKRNRRDEKNKNLEN